MKTVAIISASPQASTLHIEQWEIANVPNPHITRNRPGTSIDIPTSVGKIDTIGPVEFEGVKDDGNHLEYGEIPSAAYVRTLAEPSRSIFRDCIRY